MVKQGIQIYARAKPTKQKLTGLYEAYEDDNGGSIIAFTVPKDLADGYINNKKEVYKFRFNRVFDQDCKQDEVFEEVAQGVIDNVLTGYNGTIFAYGQTGSGKTFTITGGAERYVDRGLIPRSLSYIFEYFEKHPGTVFTAHISYLEIYNENGYDLLDPKHEASKLEDLPKVTLFEDSDNNVHLKNLSLHQASNEEEALNLLFLGDTNRMIAETPMNQASTRSHCIFTIHVSSRDPGSATIRRAKLHLVDLAGSERVGKTNVGGTLLTEAKYINLSLHYLEQVIVALSDKSRSHIPYRNSMMTSVLRDSLGGNCMTTMIATCSLEKKNIDESISTCRFAQRVAMIKNDVLLNEEIDPKLLIAQLKAEVQRLKDELAMTTGQEYTGDLTEDEMDRLRRVVKSYLEDADPEAALSVGADMRKINYCFQLLKTHVLDKGKKNPSPPPQRTPANDGSFDSSYLGNQTELNKLKELIRQRDNEINILVGMLKKEKKRTADLEMSARHGGGPLQDGVGAARERVRRSTSQTLSDDSESELSHLRSASRTRVKERPSSDTTENRHHPQASLEESNHHRPSSAYRRKLDEMSVGRKEAFETFRRDYVHNDTIEENKHNLKQRYAEAKRLGEQVNTSRQKINSIKTQIEQHRVRRSMQGFVNGTEGIEDIDPVEQKLRQAIEEEKTKYKESFTQLKSLKTEIEHLQHLLEKAKVKMQKDFEIWWAEQAAFNQPPDEVRAAWKTPPISPVRPPSAQRRRDPDPGGVSNNRGDDSSYNTRPGKFVSKLRAEAHLASLGTTSVSRPPHVSSSDSSLSNRSGPITTAGIDQGTSWRSKSGSAGDMTSGSGSVKLTGDSRADADILAFIKARQNLLQQRGHR
ncbi:kinesin-like protein KIF6 [Porites lutea]|uniref:kinesin-like protein KIF6 n=1 Tax=Porites lutea TaxID=51062 RepID=UPI003CC62868